MPNHFDHIIPKETSLESRISELEEVIKQMTKAKNDTELLDLPWVGNLGQWFWMVPSNQVIFNNRKVTNLGYKIEDLPDVVGFDYFTELLHPDDYQRVMQNMRDHMKGLRDSYEVEYRILSSNGDYIWYYDRGKITKRDENGQILVISGIVFDINKNKQLESELKEANERLSILVNIDSLTGAYNRRYTIEKLDNMIKEIKSSQNSLSLVMLDIDFFKKVNDKFGHFKGDLVLTKIVETINSNIKENYILCRWGGEEFIIILPNTAIEVATDFAEKIRIEIANKPIKSVGKITASFGVSTYISGDDSSSLINRSDNLMYDSKKQGRNKVTCQDKIH
jgi:diguanylate cyclase (GGDEF)-like protein/PAS domain S-box-containing protein